MNDDKIKTEYKSFMDKLSPNAELIHKTKEKMEALTSSRNSRTLIRRNILVRVKIIAPIAACLLLAAYATNLFNLSIGEQQNAADMSPISQASSTADQGIDITTEETAALADIEYDSLDTENTDDFILAASGKISDEKRIDGLETNAEEASPTLSGGNETNGLETDTAEASPALSGGNRTNSLETDTAEASPTLSSGLEALSTAGIIESEITGAERREDTNTENVARPEADTEQTEDSLSLNDFDIIFNFIAPDTAPRSSQSEQSATHYDGSVDYDSEELQADENKREITVYTDKTDPEKIQYYSIFFADYTLLPSSIYGKEIIIMCHEAAETNYYAWFTHQDTQTIIETTNLTQEEFIQVLLSILHNGD